MKKKNELIKTLQLVFFILITVFSLFIIFTDKMLYQMVGSNPSVRRLCLALWIAVGVSYLFILWDLHTFSSLKKDYHELDYTVYNDHIAGIANRYSCDAMVEKYLSQTLPEDVSCVMLDLLNIRHINDEYGHLIGNQTIQEFSNMLHTASLGCCFVGRNGGNKFMALFESGSTEQINQFVTRVNQRVEAYNMRKAVPMIEYRTGRALNCEEHLTAITQLISLADRRLTSQTDMVTGFSNRTSCDDIINAYSDQPLPAQVGCVMLEMTNIRDINDAAGHRSGDAVLRSFGDLLRDAAQGLCFVGRNGGVKFLAIFEDCSKEKLAAFVDGISNRVNTFNESAEHPILFRFGQAFEEDDTVTEIHQLIALSDRRSRDGQILGGKDGQS